MLRRIVSFIAGEMLIFGMLCLLSMAVHWSELESFFSGSFSGLIGALLYPVLYVVVFILLLRYIFS